MQKTQIGAGNLDNRAYNWGGSMKSVDFGTDPRIVQRVARWQSPDGQPTPMTVTVQRTNTVERAVNLDNYLDQPPAFIRWSCSGASFQAEIDACPGNSLTVTADSVEVLSAGARNDVGVGLYSASITPAIARCCATRSMFYTNPASGLEIPVPPFAKWYEAQRRSLFGSNFQFTYIDQSLNTVGEVYYPAGTSCEKHMISAEVRSLQNGVAGLLGLSVIFGIEV